MVEEEGLQFLELQLSKIGDPKTAVVCEEYFVEWHGPGASLIRKDGNQVLFSSPEEAVATLWLLSNVQLLINNIRELRKAAQMEEKKHVVPA